jgi:hypothetical protein
MAFGANHQGIRRKNIVVKRAMEQRTFYKRVWNAIIHCFISREVLRSDMFDQCPYFAALAHLARAAVSEVMKTRVSVNIAPGHIRRRKLR